VAGRNEHLTSLSHPKGYAERGVRLVAGEYPFTPDPTTDQPSTEAVNALNASTSTRSLVRNRPPSCRCNS
jgi:hypothetical protein